MKEIKKKSRYLRKAFASLLVLTLVAATMLYPDAMHPGGEAYAAESNQVTLTSSLTTVDDTTTDKVAFTISVGANATEGVSGIQFNVSYPTEFDLVSYTPGGFFDNGVSFFGETTEKDGVITKAANPFFCGFGSHEKDGVRKEVEDKASGDLVTLVFEANTTLENTKGYSFGLATGENDKTEAFLLAADDDSNPNTTYYTVVTSDVAQTYTPTSSTGTGTQATVSGETVKVTPTTTTESGSTTAAVKKQEVAKAIESAKTGEKTEVVIDAGTNGATATELTLAKESMKDVAEANKSIQIKTDAGQLTFDKAAAESIGKADGGEKLVINTKKENKITISSTEYVAAVFTVTAELVEGTNKTPVTDFGTGKVTVSLDLPSGLIGTDEDPIKCWHYDLDKKSYAPVEGEVKGEKFVFTTNHFSKFAVANLKNLEAFGEANSLQQGVTVSGKVTSYNPGNATTVQLKQNDAVKYATTIASGTGSGQVTQQFSFANVSAGTYDLVVTKAAHLTYTIKNVVVGSDKLDLTENSNTAVSDITLLVGDVNSDDNINVADLNTVWNAANFNKATSSATNALTDINGDGSVNVTDLNIVWNAANFNKGVSNCTVDITEEKA